MEKKIDFEVSTSDGKYTIRIFEGGGYDVLRHGQPWIDHEMTTSGLLGTNCWYQLACDLNAYRTGDGSAEALMPYDLAKSAIASAKLPKGDDGVTPLPVPVAHVEEMLTRTITRDRDRGPLNIQAIINAVINAVMPRVQVDGSFVHIETFSRIQLERFMHLALATAQARGARIKKAISEDDYEEASRAGHEAFMSCLKDKGLFQP